VVWIVTIQIREKWTCVTNGTDDGICGLYVTGDPGAVDEAAKIGALSIRIGLGWAKSCSFHTGQCPVLRYNRSLMMAILHEKVRPRP
jgi:glutathione-independent formaldehyde dehydrogenase